MTSDAVLEALCRHVDGALGTGDGRSDDGVPRGMAQRGARVCVRCACACVRARTLSHVCRVCSCACNHVPSLRVCVCSFPCFRYRVPLVCCALSLISPQRPATQVITKMESSHVRVQGSTDKRKADAARAYCVCTLVF